MIDLIKFQIFSKIFFFRLLFDVKSNGDTLSSTTFAQKKFEKKVESMDVSQKKICVKKVGSTMSHPMAPLEMIDHLELVIDENALEEAEKQK